MMTHRERLRDESGFIHKKIGGFIGGLPVIGGIAKEILGGVPLVGGLAQDFFFGGVPGTQAGCPPGFIASPTGCVPLARVGGGGQPITSGGIGSLFGGGIADLLRRKRLGGAPALPPTIAPRLPAFRGNGLALGGGGSLNGRVPRPDVPTLAVTGQFGAGFEASIVSREMRLCPPKTVLGVDGVCYNRRDLRNDERAWPRGRRPLLTGGEMRAVSTASAAAKKLQRKQKQLQELGLLPKPQRTRRALLPGHRATLTHAGGVSEHN